MRLSTDLTLDFAERPGTALVTGGTGGIGAAVVRALAERGSDVTFTYRANEDRARELAAEVEELGQRAVPLQLDLVDAEAVAAAVEQVGAAGLHAVVHAAGPHVPMIHLSRVSPAQYRQQLDAEAAAFFNLVHATLPALRASQGGLVAVTTAATRRFPVRDGLSAGTKGAVEATARAFAVEEGRFGVRINCVGPGMLQDGMAERLISSGELNEGALEVTRRNIPMRRFGTANDIAELTAFLLSDRASFITGQMIDVDGGYTV